MRRHVISVAVLGCHTEGDQAAHEPRMGVGKGLTPGEAMIAAAGEALERYSASRYEGANLVRATLDSLAGDVLDPRRLCLYDASQYRQRGFPFVRFQPRRPIDWVRGRWLDTHMAVWVPALLAYLDYDANPRELFCQATSNGLAAGAGFEDAAFRAVLELVERDACMITWLAQRPARRLLLDDTVEEVVHETIRRRRRSGIDVQLFLVDVGLSIPTVVCLGLGDGKRWPAVTMDAAAHVSIRTAIRKAVVGGVLTASYVRKLSRGRAIPRRPKDVRTPGDHALYYAPASRARVLDFIRYGNEPAIRLSDLPEADPREISLGSCIKRLAANGVRVAAVDVTSADIATGPFRVVRTLAPGMQPVDFGFAFRRLPCPRLKAMLTGKPNPHPHPLT